MTHTASRFCFSMVLVSSIAMLGLTVGTPVNAQRPAATAAASPAMPRYDADGSLRLPNDYRQWVFLGSSLGLSYSEGQRGAELFHHTLMEPTAYEHYARTGEFREGTMLALLLHPTKDATLPGRQGRIAGDLVAVEMSVKDKSHSADGWSYYNFTDASGIRGTAKALPKNSCYNCHAEHAASDNVFLQYYTLLAAAHAPARGRTLATAAAATPGPASTPRAAAVPAAAKAPVAVTGLDPVLLVGGREEMGKPEIVAVHDGYTYQFVSEPNRKAFVADPAKYAIQNKTCLVVPGAAISAGLFAVHNQRIYAFATPDCVTEFSRNPAAYLPRESKK